MNIRYNINIIINKNESQIINIEIIIINVIVRYIKIIH